MKKTVFAIMLATVAAGAFAAPNSHSNSNSNVNPNVNSNAKSASWINISSPSTSGFTVGSNSVTYGPTAANSVWVYDGANPPGNQSAAGIGSLITTQFGLPSTGVGSLKLIGQNDNQSSNSFTLQGATNYLAIHYGRGELLFHWDTPLAANTVFTIDNLPRGISNYRAFSAISPVPEPSAYAMMVCGLGLVGLMARKRKRS